MVILGQMKLFSKIYKTDKTGPYYYRILISIIIISLIPSTLMTLYYSKSSLTLIRDKAKETNLLYLKLMSNSLDIVMNNILDFSNLLAIDNIFKDYVRISGKKYFEQFSDISFNYTDQDFKRLYEYLNIRGEIYDTLNTMTLSNEFIESIYFLDSSRNIVFKNGRLPQPFESFPDKAWYKIISSEELLPYIMSIRTIEREDQSRKNIISIISENIEENIPFIINLNADILYQKIISSVGWNPDNIFFILSKSGEPILYSSKDSHIINKISILAENDYSSNTDFLTISDRKFMISSLIIDPLGWTVYSATDAENFQNLLKPFRIRIFILSMLFFPLSLLFAYYLGQKLYTPIKKLSGYVKTLHPESEINKTSGNGDLGLIWKTLKTSELREKKLEEKFRESLPSYRKDFLKRLLTDHNYKINEILERLNYIVSPLRAENLAVMIIQPDDSHNRSLSLPDRLVLGLEIEKIIQNDFFKTFPGEFLSITSFEYCIIFNLPDSDLKAAGSEIEEHLHSLKNQMSMNFTFGIGSPARSIFDLNKVYSEALDAIRLRSLADTGQTIFYEDLKIGETQSQIYDSGTKTSLLKDCIKQGNSEESIQVMNDIYTDLTKLKDTFSFIKAKQLYITILNEIFNTINDLGLDSDEILSRKNPFEELFALGTIKEINNWMIALLNEITYRIYILSEEKKNKKIETIISIIEKECGQDINLNIIANRINLNPSYVSRLFKEHMNLSFIDYLTDVRMNKAMNLLKNTNLKINEIASEVGYFNSNYFIRIFKKKTGRTPGKYRNLF